MVTGGLWCRTDDASAVGLQAPRFDYYICSEAALNNVGVFVNDTEDEDGLKFPK